MDFKITTELPQKNLDLPAFAKTAWFGSCFAQQVGEKMKDLFLQADVNPFGILYNPESIALGLNLILENAFSDSYLFQDNDGMWHSWLHSGAFDNLDKSICLQQIQNRISKTHSELKNWNTLFVTFGTNHVYRLKTNSQIVGNCHKESANSFQEDILTVEQIATTWKALISKIIEQNSTLKIVFTISPYRYIKYGLHGNQLSKSVLFLSVDNLCKTFPKQCFYFPAYEIITDELRDYRFYKADMVHPSEQAVDYVWEIFTNWALGKEAKAASEEMEKIVKAFAHRPLHPESEAYQQFKKETRLKWEQIKMRYNIKADLSSN